MANPTLELVGNDPTKTIEPMDETQNTVKTEQPKKRGPYKPRGEKTESTTAKKPAGKKERITERQLTGLLYMGHLAAANQLKIPEIEIQETEAEQLAKAIVDVMQFYDFEVSAKSLAWANLAGTMATIYGFKIADVLNKRKAAKTEPQDFGV